MSLFKRLFGRGEEYNDQLSMNSLSQLWEMLPSISVEIWQVIEPRAHIEITEAMFIPNLLQEFNLDKSLGLLHGRGKGHAFIRVSALRHVTSVLPRTPTDYQELVRAFRNSGYSVRRVDYISFEAE